ncbi:hypothetical protein EAF04_009357 [Stromatinia cepivora]|nr:hypothetical protein EAF04_009357 [Stromatinia cepivora]
MDIAKLENENHLAFTEKEWIERVNHKTTKEAGLKQWNDMNEPFRKYIKDIAASSGKLAVMKKYIDEFKNKTDPKDSKPCRMIFASYFYIGARILYLWMIHILGIPEEDIVFLDKVITSREFDRRLELWHGHVDIDNLRLKPKQPRYMVATSTSFGIGLTLSEAVLIALLEPDYSVANELQTFSRHDRIGNRNKETYSHLCFIEDNARENLIRRRNHARKGISKTLERKVVNLQNIKSSGATQEDAIEVEV